MISLTPFIMGKGVSFPTGDSGFPFKALTLPLRCLEPHPDGTPEENSMRGIVSALVCSSHKQIFVVPNASSFHLAYPFTVLALYHFLPECISPVPFGFRNHCFFIDLPPRITTPEFPASSAKFPSTLPYCYFLSKWRNNSLSTVQLHLSSSYLSQTHGILELIWKNFCFSYSLCDLFMWIITFES